MMHGEDPKNLVMESIFESGKGDGEGWTGGPHVETHEKEVFTEGLEGGVGGGLGEGGSGVGDGEGGGGGVEGGGEVEVEVPVKGLKYKHARGGRRFSYNKFKLGYGLKLLELIKERRDLKLVNQNVNGEKTWSFWSSEGCSDIFFLFGTDSIKTIHYYDMDKEQWFQRGFVKYN
jgi:N-acetylneuraminic acid mutarotase